MLNYYQMLNVLPKIIPFLAAIAALYVPMSVGRCFGSSVRPSVSQQQVSRSVLKLLDIEIGSIKFLGVSKVNILPISSVF